MLPSDAFELPIIPVPPKPVVDAMDGIVRPILRRQDEGRVESRTLAALRDTLLPKLMSGELRICDAERALAEAV
jgi:type I restriction enzyme S subunit